MNTIVDYFLFGLQACGKTDVTLQVPPNSGYFDPSAAKKLPTGVAAVPLAAPTTPIVVDPPSAAPSHPPPQMPYLPPQTPYAMPYMPPPWGYHLPPYQYAPPGPSSGPQGPQPTPQFGILQASSANNSPLPSPGKISRLKVLLSDFCMRYKISDSDQSKLALLEYTPGNKDVVELEEADWKEVKFTKLGWKAFLRAHQQFMKDVKAGLWAAI